MRCEIIVAAALAALSATSARADEWCGYGARDKSPIECGYTSAAQCETATGKGGTCFVDPDYALNTKRVTPVIAAKASASHSWGVYS